MLFLQRETCLTCSFALLDHSGGRMYIACVHGSSVHSGRSMGCAMSPAGMRSVLSLGHLNTLDLTKVPYSVTPHSWEAWQSLGVERGSVVALSACAVAIGDTVQSLRRRMRMKSTIGIHQWLRKTPQIQRVGLDISPPRWVFWVLRHTSTPGISCREIPSSSVCRGLRRPLLET